MRRGKNQGDLELGSSVASDYFGNGVALNRKKKWRGPPCHMIEVSDRDALRAALAANENSPGTPDAVASLQGNLRPSAGSRDAGKASPGRDG
jgi:hypothetical protein